MSFGNRIREYLILKSEPWARSTFQPLINWLVLMDLRLKSSGQPILSNWLSHQLCSQKLTGDNGKSIRRSLCFCKNSKAINFGHRMDIRNDQSEFSFKSNKKPLFAICSFTKFETKTHSLTIIPHLWLVFYKRIRKFFLYSISIR